MSRHRRPLPSASALALAYNKLGTIEAVATAFGYHHVTMTYIFEAEHIDLKTVVLSPGEAVYVNGVQIPDLPEQPR